METAVMENFTPSTWRSSSITVPGLPIMGILSLNKIGSPMSTVTVCTFPFFTVHLTCFIPANVSTSIVVFFVKP